MLTRILTGALLGVDAYPVEVDLAPRLLSFATVGLPDLPIREATNRGNAALMITGFELAEQPLAMHRRRSGLLDPLRQVQAGAAPRP